MNNKWKREGSHTVVPYLIVNGAAQLIEFLEKTFDAVVTENMKADGVIRHAEVKIGDTLIMMGEGCAEYKATANGFYIYVEDVDSSYHRALKNGATSVMKPADQFYGDRSGGVQDPTGNTWWIATHKEEIDEKELQKRFDAAAKQTTSAGKK